MVKMKSVYQWMQFGKKEDTDISKMKSLDQLIFSLLFCSLKLQLNEIF